MFNLFNSEPKTKIFSIIGRKPGMGAKEIAHESKVNYKNSFKILQEFVDNGILEKNDGNYYVKSEFIEYLKNITDDLVKNNTQSIYMKNKLDIYNTLITIYPEDDIREDIEELIDDWLMEKLADWYAKFYDHENKEYDRIKEIIEDKFKDHPISILEIGCGTGRITTKLAHNFNYVKGIDLEDRYIKYCKRKFNLKNLHFEKGDIRKFIDDQKYDVIVFSWIGFHYYDEKDIDEIILNLKKLIHENSRIIIMDAYYSTEYIDILQMIRPMDMDKVKILKEKLNEKLISVFNNLNQEVLLTKYVFDSINDAANNFKIELTLEESHIWTDNDENKLREYLLKKDKPIEIGEGLWINIIDRNPSTN